MFKHKCDSTFLFLSLLEKDQTCEKLCVSANENSSTAMTSMVTLACFTDTLKVSKTLKNLNLQTVPLKPLIWCLNTQPAIYMYIYYQTMK